MAMSKLPVATKIHSQSRFHPMILPPSRAWRSGVTHDSPSSRTDSLEERGLLQRTGDAFHVSLCPQDVGPALPHGAGSKLPNLAMEGGDNYRRKEDTHISTSLTDITCSSAMECAAQGSSGLEYPSPAGIDYTSRQLDG
jgi:hypothetical protein